MSDQTVSYQVKNTYFKGKIYYPEDSLKAPLVLVIPAWRGLDVFAQDKAKELADKGYVGFAIDLYGDGKVCTTDQEASSCMTPLFIDRKTLRTRLQAAYDAGIKDERVKKEQVAVIGFCFGGLAALELWKSGAPLKGVITFHALIGDSLGNLEAEKEAFSPCTNSSLLLLHGYLDPLVPAEDMQDFHALLDAKKVDWQQITYGKASHAFTNPAATDKQNGLNYEEISCRRSFNAMYAQLKELFPL